MASNLRFQGDGGDLPVSSLKGKKDEMSDIDSMKVVGSAAEVEESDRKVVKMKDDSVPPKSAIVKVKSGEQADQTQKKKGKKKRKRDICFEGYARVFFFGKSDQTERQIMSTMSPALDPTVTTNSYVFVTINSRLGTLNLYPSKVTDMDRRPVRPIVDPPIDLRYFLAEHLPNSVCSVALFARHDFPSTVGAGKSRRYVFRLEFRNDSIFQNVEKIQDLQLASRKAAKTSRKNESMSGVKSAAVNLFSSHDGVEAAKQMAEQKLQDSYSRYMTGVRGMMSDPASLARKFVRRANVVTLSIPPNAASATSAIGFAASAQPQPTRGLKPSLAAPVSRKQKTPKRKDSMSSSSSGDSSSDSFSSSSSSVSDMDASAG